VLRVFGRATTNRAVGIDISSTTVKLLELSRLRDHYRVESFGVVAIPPEVVIERDIIRPDLLGEAIKELLDKTSCKAQQAITAVSGSQAIIKVVSMPAGLSDEDLEVQLALEADQYIPYPINEVALDFEVLGPSTEKTNEIDVLVVACRLQAVQTRVEALEAAGLVPTVIDVEQYAWQRALSLFASQLPTSDVSAIAVVDVGAATTNLSVIVGDRILFTRENSFGGKQLTDAIADRYDLSISEAGFAKKYGGLPEDYELEVLNPYREALVQQISRALQFFFSSSDYTELDCLLLCGGVASLEGLVSTLEDRLLTPVFVADPVGDMSVAPDVDHEVLVRESPALVTTCGLAMRGLE